MLRNLGLIICFINMDRSNNSLNVPRWMGIVCLAGILQGITIPIWATRSVEFSSANEQVKMN